VGWLVKPVVWMNCRQTVLAWAGEIHLSGLEQEHERRPNTVEVRRMIFIGPPNK
jgi:hypothetical protein